MSVDKLDSRSEKELPFGASNSAKFGEISEKSNIGLSVAVQEIELGVKFIPVLKTPNPPLTGTSEVTGGVTVLQFRIGSVVMPKLLTGGRLAEFMRGLKISSKQSMGKRPSMFCELRGDSSRLRSKSSSELGGERGKFAARLLY